MTLHSIGLKTIVFDIDGTILINDLPSPDWDNPQAIHPITRENVCGDMPEYWAHNRLNPELREGDLEQIEYILTGRPIYRKKMTITELGDHNIFPLRTSFYPGNWLYTHDRCMNWKVAVLNITLGADYYVDNDPEVKKRLTPLLPSKCKVITVAEWQELTDAGFL